MSDGPASPEVPHDLSISAQPSKSAYLDPRSSEQMLEEADSLRIKGLDTVRNIVGYSHSLGFSSDKDFIEYIKDKNVCDVGSGWGGLAIDVDLQGIHANISSVNPSIARPLFKEKQKKALMKAFGGSFSEEQIDSAILAHDRHAYAALADKIPLPDNTQDIIIDNNAVTYYAENLGEDLYKKSLLEMMRILKPGGKLRIGAQGRYGGKDYEWMEERALKDLGLDYEIFYADPYPISLGVEITK